LPEIRISPKFKALLEDPNQTEETKSYIKERIAAALAFKEAVTRRQQTVSAIANAIFERQQDFFTKGFAALNPLTEQEIANKVGVHTTTVSRTVRDKYASTPQGTVELRRLFASKVKTAVGSEVSQNAVLSELKQIVSEEDGKNPLSDNKIAELLSKAGFPIARRTVAKYRMRLKIPDAAARRN
jgi:RNA polymerase sigma-54 factor